MPWAQRFASDPPQPKAFQQKSLGRPYANTPACAMERTESKTEISWDKPGLWTSEKMWVQTLLQNLVGLSSEKSCCVILYRGALWEESPRTWNTQVLDKKKLKKMERFTRPDQSPWLVTVMSCSCHWTYWTTHGSSRLHLCTGPVVQHLFFLVAEVDVWGSCYLSEFSPGVQDGPPGYGHKKIWGKDWYTIGVLGFQIWHGSLFWYIYIYTHIYMYIYIHTYT